MNSLQKTPVVIYAESTPNPAAMKFVANKIILENSLPLEFVNSAEAKSYPLASELFKFPFVKSVFISANYITLLKTDAVQWEDVMLEVREFLKQYLQTRPLPLPLGGGEKAPQKIFPAVDGEDIEVSSAPQNETERKIADVLEQYVAPAVEQDGGMIVFRSYKDGIVTLRLKGACSGCPSSIITLKSGVEALLKKFVPEVKEVVSET